MSKHSNCYWGDYFAEYSMNICNHPQNKKHHSDANCRGCKLFVTRRQHRIAELRHEIAVCKSELDDLLAKELRKNKCQ